MNPKNKRWLVSAPITPQAEDALRLYPPLLRQILFNRGYASGEEARAYLDPEAYLEPSYDALMGVPESVDRILYAIDHDELTAIYGDYDVDGVTATALLSQTLNALGGNVRGYIPNRFDEGYGLNPDALSTLQSEGVKLVISVDCGIRSPEEAAHAKTIGLNLIITDHHQPSKEMLPPAFAIINPKQTGDGYADKDLAGVGVAYKLVEALAGSSEETSHKINPAEMLDLVALGTVADLAPLVGENRNLVRKGLQELKQTKRKGIFSLAAVSGISLSGINTTSIGFILGPRLNAAGRLESALAAYELLTTSDVRRAGELAQQLDIQNRQRQEITRRIQAEAEAMVLAEDPEAELFFAVHPDFNAGVVGLAASRLVDTYYRPAVVGQVSSETTRCSCRSIPEFHITEALDQCRDLLIRHGGHAAAAGFQVRNENLEELRDRLKSIAKNSLHGRDLRQTLTADAEIPLMELKPELLRQLALLQPTGYGNPEANFVSRDVRVTESRTVGVEGRHLKLKVNDGRFTLDAIGFGFGHLQPNLPSRVDVLYTFESNEFNGRTTLQLRLKDIKPAGSLD
jgi:single-stranded-DNA-specific exonuclease